MLRFSAEKNRRLNHATASIGLTSILVVLVGTLFTAMPNCTVGRGFDLFLYGAIMFTLLSFGVLGVLFVAFAALPGWYFGKRAIVAELILVVAAIVALIIYGSIPHPAAPYAAQCLATSSAF